jgi:drug/metabolite transporter (DMT)-like permease
MTSPSSPALKAYFALLVTVLIWGISPAYIRAFSLAAGPHDSIFIRLVGVSLLCAALLPFSGWRIERKDWGRFLITSWIGIFGYFLGSIYGFAFITAGPGDLLFATQSLMIAGLAAALGTDRLTPSILVGFAVAFAGTLYLLSGDLALGGVNPVLGAICILACSAAFAVNVVLSKPLVHAYGPLRVTFVNLALSGVPALLFYRAEAWAVLASLDSRAWFALFYLGPLGTIFASVIWNYAVGKLPPSSVGGSLYTTPLLAAFAGWLILGEPITQHTLIAGAIILAGVAMAEYGKVLVAKFQV